MSQATNGQFILPNGLKIQWGAINGTSSVNFPTPYSVQPFFMAIPVNDNVEIALTTTVHTLTTKGANTVTYYFDSTGQHVYQTGTLMWFAIGY